MNVASLDPCKELYELSGWDDLLPLHPDYADDPNHKIDDVTIKFTPAYDLGYLLRKIQGKLPKGEYVGMSADNDPKGSWFASISNDHSIGDTSHGNTPEDAVCKLAIELFK